MCFLVSDRLVTPGLCDIYSIYIYDIQFATILRVRVNEILLRERSDGAAQLRALGNTGCHTRWLIVFGIKLC